MDLLCGLAVLTFCAALAAAIFAARMGARLPDPRTARDERERLARQLEAAIRDEAEQTRRAIAAAGTLQRQELAAELDRQRQTLASQHELLGKQLESRLGVFGQQLGAATHSMDQRLLSLQTDSRAGRSESAETLTRFGENLRTSFAALGEANNKLLAELRQSVESRLHLLQTENGARLEEMRKTVDEKLNATLEARLGASFNLVSERLEQVQRGLGEMQTLATGVGDLNRMITGVKTRGIWGEVQLENLLDQVLTQQQYERNVAVKRGSGERVDFAIRLPGRGEAHEIVWLPIDAKFPREDYERLLNAADKGDKDAVDAAGSQLEARIKLEARSIRDKYIDPPNTTDFALMYLPVEGLYAEVLRRPGLMESLQNDCRITIAGPTTLTALLNSLQMGFRTLAIQKRSSEVWTVLGGVKTEFGKFQDIIARTKKKLQEASNTIDGVESRSRVITRKLRDVEAMPEAVGDAALNALTEESESMGMEAED
jgi:DNA recombination protein RmuC